MAAPADEAPPPLSFDGKQSWEQWAESERVRARKFFKELWQPQVEEIRSWAYTPKDKAPFPNPDDQDWDLTVLSGGLQHVQLVVELILDPKVKHSRRTFRGMAYTWAAGRAFSCQEPEQLETELQAVLPSHIDRNAKYGRWVWLWYLRTKQYNSVAPSARMARWEWERDHADWTYHDPDLRIPLPPDLIDIVVAFMFGTMKQLKL
eukprot:TRINITY_DN35557_c0_g1_i1.p1 TRINITY_DN35557_c0_g1~~TRINITY_DN35557_c0_g1_i1.p1  ORF type:complete len:205 (-),score=8.84 TRINITY_DN35557_c0_g1_i1:115-729(-)